MVESLRFVVEEICPTTLKVFPLRVYNGTFVHDLVLRKGQKWLRYDEDTCLTQETSSCNSEDLREIIRLSNVITSIYRYLVENEWFENEVTYRSFQFFQNLYETLVPFEFSDPDVWHITNCPQNAYDSCVCQRIWASYVEPVREADVRLSD